VPDIYQLIPWSDAGLLILQIPVIPYQGIGYLLPLLNN